MEDVFPQENHEYVQRSKEFQSRLGNTRNLYGKPGAAKKIANIIRELEIPFMPTKKFFDLG